MTAGIETDLKLQDYLPYRLSVLSNAVSRGVAERYQRDFNISVWQWRVMAVTGDTPGISATEIGQRTAMDKVAVSRAVAGLIELGYMERTTSESDGRRSQLFLTDEGQNIYELIVPIALQAERELFETLSPADQKDLARLMDKLADAASPDRKLW